MKLLTRILPGKSRTVVPLQVLLLMAGPALTSCLHSMVYPAPGYAVPSPPPAPFREVQLITALKDRIHAWEYEYPGRPIHGRRPVVLYLHGNGENIAVLWKADILQALAGLRITFLAPDYPGYGRSTGTPTRTSLTAMARRALAYLRRKYPDSPAVVIGHSLGAAAAMQLARHEQANLKGMVLISPFTTLRDAAGVHFSHCLTSMAPLDNYDSKGIAPRIRVPVLVVHGGHDHIIPYQMGRTLARAMGGPAEFLLLHGRGHNDIVDAKATLERMGAFMDALERNRLPVTPGKGLSEDDDC